MANDKMMFKQSFGPLICLVLLLFSKAYPPASAQVSELEVAHFAWSPVEDRVAVILRDGELAILRIQTSQGLILSENPLDPKFLGPMRWKPDGTQFSMVNDVLSIWDAQGNLLAELTSHNMFLNEADWSPDGKKLASVSSGTLGPDTRKTLIFWDTMNFSEISNIDVGNNLSCVWYNNDQIILGSSSAGLALIPIDANISRYDLINYRVSTHTTISSLAWSPDYRYLAAGSYKFSTNQYYVGIWDWTSQTEILQLPHADFVESLAWQSNNILATGSKDGLVQIWDVPNQQILRTIDLNNRRYSPEVAWSPDGSTLAYTGLGTELILLPLSEITPLPPSPTP